MIFSYQLFGEVGREFFGEIGSVSVEDFNFWKVRFGVKTRWGVWDVPGGVFFEQFSVGK